MFSTLATPYACLGMFVFTSKYKDILGGGRPDMDALMSQATTLILSSHFQILVRAPPPLEAFFCFDFAPRCSGRGEAFERFPSHFSHPSREWFCILCLDGVSLVVVMLRLRRKTASGCTKLSSTSVSESLASEWRYVHWRRKKNVFASHSCLLS